MRTIAVLNQKGGVGKTTTTANIAAALAASGRRVVVIDLDPQAHLTIHLGVEPQTVQPGSYEVLTQSADFEQSLMMVRSNLWLMGANINLVGAETELVSVVGREIILREAMQSAQDRFDFCLIDCAPSLGLLSLNALAASQEVLIPLQPHFLALQGFGKLLQTVDLVNKRINRELKVSGVLLCMFDTRASLPNEVRADIERFLDNARGSACAWADARLVPTFIRRNIKLAEAPSYGKTIFEYDPTCNGAEDYRRVAQFFLGVESEAERDVESEPVQEFAPEAVPDAQVTPAETARVEWEPKTAPAESEAGVTYEEIDDLLGDPDEPIPFDCESDPADEVEAIVESELQSWSGGGHETPPSVVADSEGVEPSPSSSDLRLPSVEPLIQDEGQSETEVSDEGPGSAPIEIREVYPPMPRRYSPPPLKSYPIPPSRRSQESPTDNNASNESAPSESDSPDRLP
ncbi:MAG: AAA family ATPase [Sedimentisphaerales bacterium]|nr:AAA family ATPase [Sedimentisphaerales bacterium]NLT76957.1 ParA family protein [Planctomycetota bacterium]